MENMQTFIISVVIVGVTLVVGIYIASQIESQMTDGTAEANASADLVTALANGTGWVAILVVVGFATIILALLTSGLGSTAPKGQGSPVY